MVLPDTELRWKQFAQEEKLTDEQLQHYKTYYNLLVTENELMNLTAITDLPEVIAYHFQDSLRLGDIYDLNIISCIADVGSGAGFPAIPLKIRYSHLSVVLIEVSQKRVTFLRKVIVALNLQHIEICTLDWRTFLRKTAYQIDIFCARASLAVPELLHLYKPSSPYRCAALVYWASEKWEATENEKKVIKKEYFYPVGIKKRKLVVFSCIECII